MYVIRYIRQLYSLDTLDTRFTTSARTPLTKTTSESASTSAPPQEKVNAVAEFGTRPSKWNTTEFYFYYLVFIVAIPQMFKAVIDISQRTGDIQAQ